MSKRSTRHKIPKCEENKERTSMRREHMLKAYVKRSIKELEIRFPL